MTRRSLWTRIRRAAWPVTVAVAVAAIGGLAVLPALVTEGLVATRAAGDSPFLLQRTYEYARALGAGHLPPRWMADAAYGLGYPFFNYYAPLAYAAAGGLALLGAGIVGSLKVVMLAAFLGAAAGMYAVGRRLWGSPAAGLVVAASYTYAPYHMVNLYVRGDALSELAAYAVFPWAILATDRLLDEPSAGRIAGVGISLGLLLVSHNVSALLFGLVLAGYWAWRLGQMALVSRRASPDLGPGNSQPSQGLTADAPSERLVGHGPDSAASQLTEPALAAGDASDQGHPVLDWTPPGLVRRAMVVWEERRPRRPLVAPGSRRLVGLVIAGLLGMALAAWFWVPALVERDAVQLEANRTGYFRFDARDADGEYIHFRGLDLVAVDPVVDYQVAEGCTPCRTGLVQAIVALAGILGLGIMLWLRSGAAPPTGLAVFWLGVAAVSTLMMTPLSAPIWQSVPLLDFAQFPWRWLAVQAAALALLSGALARLRMAPVLVPLAIAGVAASGMLQLPVSVLPVGDVDRSELTAYEVFTGNIGSTVRTEYLPQAVEPRPWSGPAATVGGAGRPRVTGGQLAAATLTHASPGKSTWLLTVTEPVTATVAFPTLWFPGWMATLTPVSASGAPFGAMDSTAAATAAQVSGSAPQVSDTAPVDGLGWISAQIPPGSWLVGLSLERTPIRAAAEVVSLLALLLLVLIILADRRRGLLRLLLQAGLVVAVGLLAARIMPVADAAGPRVLDAAMVPLPHRMPEGVAFGTSTLRSALIQPPQVDAGGELQVMLEWDDPWGGSLVRVDLVSPAEPVYHVPDVRATAEATQDAANRLSLGIPESAPTGLYFVRLTVTNNDRDIDPEAADGTPLGQVYLGPVRVVGQHRFRDIPAEPVARMGSITLHAVQAGSVAERPDLLEVRLYWQTDRLLNANYVTSVRLVDPDGDVVAQEDKQPLYGFFPATAWQPGQQVGDIRWLTLPDGLDATVDYFIDVVVYDAATMQQLGGIGRVAGVSVAGPAPQEPEPATPEPAEVSTEEASPPP